MSLLTTVMFLSVSSLCDAEAASKVVDDYSLKEVTANLTSESVSVTDYNGNPLGVDVSGPYDQNRDYTVKALVDGYEGSWSGIASVNERNEKQLGWFIVDLGKLYPVSRVSVTMQHDWAGIDYVVQLAETSDFANPITIYNNDMDGSLGLGNTFTADSKVAVIGELSNWGNYGADFDKAGNVWNFNPVNARYVRVTNNQYGNGVVQNYSACGEINVYSYDYKENPTKPNEVAPVAANLVSGVVYGNQKLELSTIYDDAKIYYTTNGNVPTRLSKEYTEPISLSVGETYKIRAIVIVNGVKSRPVDLEYVLEGREVNVTSGLKAKLTSLDGTQELHAIDAGDNIADNVMMLTDGSFSLDGCFRLASYDGTSYTQTLGWATLDLGDTYPISKIVMSTWQGWGFKKVIIQVANNPDFSDAVTIFNNDDQKTIIDQDVYSADPNVSTHWNLSNHGAVGNTNDLNGNVWEFDAVNCRYIRVTNNTNDPACTYFTELQAYVIEKPESENYEGKNLAAGLEAKLTSLDGTQTYYAIDAGENILDNVMMLTDGSYSVDGCFRLASYDGSVYTQQRGWATLDLGANYYVGQINMSAWQGWGFKQVVIQVAKNADFSDAITIYSNDDRCQVVNTGAYSIDPSVSTHWDMTNHGAIGNTNDLNGNTWNFDAIECRYVRVTNYTNDPIATYLTELQVIGAKQPQVSADDYEGKNLAQGVKPSLVSIDGSTQLYTVDPGSTDVVDIDRITDGSYDAFAGTRLASYDGSTYTPTTGWAVVDLGANYYIGQIDMAMWHNFSFKQVVIQVAKNADFSDAITIYSNDDQKQIVNVGAYSIDPTISTHWQLSNHGNIGNTTDTNGNSWVFDAIECRYVRFTNNAAEATYFTELKVIGAKNPNPPMEDEENKYEYVEYINGIEYEESLTIKTGYSLEDLNEMLNGLVKVTLSDGTVRSVVGTWTIENYVSDSSGEYNAVLVASEDGDLFELLSDVNVKLVVQKYFIDATISDKDYDGEKAELVITSEHDTYTVKYYSGNTLLEAAPVDAGTYKVVVEIGEGVDYVKVEKEYTINKLNTHTLTATIESKTYDGQVAELVVDASAEYQVKYYLGTEELSAAPVNAGTYKVVVVIPESTNYVGKTVEKEFTIGKAAAPSLTVSVSNKTYDGQIADVTINLTEGYTVEYYSGNTLLDAAPVNAGTYKVVVTVAESANAYGTSANKTYTISKASLDLTVTLADKVYDGNAVTLTVTGSTEYTVKWYKGSEELTAAPVNAGEYDVVLSVAESDNYLAALVEKEVTISKADLNITVSYSGAQLTVSSAKPVASDFTVTGAEGTLAILVPNLAEGKVTVSYEFTPANENYNSVLGTIELTVNADQEVPGDEPKDPTEDPKDPTEDPKDPTEDPKDPTQEPQNPGKGCNGGCQGSVIASLAGIAILATSIVILKKKREE